MKTITLDVSTGSKEKGTLVESTVEVLMPEYKPGELAVFVKALEAEEKSAKAAELKVIEYIIQARAIEKQGIERRRLQKDAKGPEDAPKKRKGAMAQLS